MVILKGPSQDQRRDNTSATTQIASKTKGISLIVLLSVQPLTINWRVVGNHRISMPESKSTLNIIGDVDFELSVLNSIAQLERHAPTYG